MKTVVMSSGGWGTALSIVLRDNGHDVTLWSHSADKAAQLRQTRENPLLKGVKLPAEIHVTDDLAPLHEAELVVFAAPSFALRGVVRQAAAHLRKDALLVSVTKGIEPRSHLRMSQIVREESGSERVVALSGPSHAEEVALRKPTGCVAASPSQEDAETVQNAFMNDAFRVYTHDDTVGVELSGALKNVVALCCGIVDGCELGDNAKALLMTRALTEMARLTEKLGGRSDTLAGLAGVGDLIVTCTSMHSRNHRAGILIGQGLSADEAAREVGAVVEGCYAARSARELSDELGIDMPICRAVYAVLYEGARVDSMAHALMSRLPKRESDSCWV